MKKTIVGLFLVMMAVSATAYAGATIDQAGTSIGTQAFRPSNNVTLEVSSVPGDSLAIGAFALLSYHGSGNREFSTNSTESKIYWQNSPTADHTAVSAITVTAANPPTFGLSYSGWNSL